MSGASVVSLMPKRASIVENMESIFWAFIATDKSRAAIQKIFFNKLISDQTKIKAFV